MSNAEVKTWWRRRGEGNWRLWEIGDTGLSLLPQAAKTSPVMEVEMRR